MFRSLSKAETKPIQLLLALSFLISYACPGAIAGETLNSTPNAQPASNLQGPPGFGDTSGSAGNATSIGSGSAATGEFSSAYGTGSNAAGESSSAFGGDSGAVGISSSAFGAAASATQTGSSAIGANSAANGESATA